MNGVKTIGIVGGGQLGRMMTQAAKPLGFHVVVIDPTPNSPAAQVGADEITADFYDHAALRKLAELADFITIEAEHNDETDLEVLATLGKPVNPAVNTLRIIQDKLKQKQFLHSKGVEVGPFAEVTGFSQGKKLLNDWGGKMLVKVRQGAFDGRGNMVVESPEQLRTALKKFAGKELYAEKFIPFVKELAVMIARDLKGRVVLYPVAETVHARNICLEVAVPAQIDASAYKKAEDLARQAAKHLEGAGVFGIEMFLTPDGEVLVNEIAPRVHNSGHYTLDACHTSQFEQHVRAITGLPLGNTELAVPTAVMINILGERSGPARPTGLKRALGIPKTAVHLYGKAPTKIDRKMGHITSIGNDVTEARQHAATARKRLSI
jgi:5-(carboxyamino)imidazole ribonucleotide synthase